MFCLSIDYLYVLPRACGQQLLSFRLLAYLETVFVAETVPAAWITSNLYVQCIVDG